MGNASRYAQLAESLAGDIRAGRYPVGSRLPGEIDLAVQYGLSRHTVREAIRQLSGQGLVARRQGIGTLVRSAQPASRYVAELSSLEDLHQHTSGTELEILAERSVLADVRLAARLHCKPGRRWMVLDCLRRLPGTATPIAHAELIIDPSYDGVRALADHRSDRWFFQLIEERYGVRIAEVEQEVGAVAIPARIAVSLRVKSGSTGLRIIRRYLNGEGIPVSGSINTYPAGRFRFSMRWRFDQRQA